MPGTIRYHTDEDVNHNPTIAFALRQRGVDVTTTSEAGLRGASDEAQLAYAKTEGRVLITHDFRGFSPWKPRHFSGSGGNVPRL